MQLILNKKNAMLKVSVSIERRFVVNFYEAAGSFTPDKQIFFSHIIFPYHSLIVRIWEAKYMRGANVWVSLETSLECLITASSKDLRVRNFRATMWLLVTVLKRNVWRKTEAIWRLFWQRRKNSLWKVCLVVSHSHHCT